MRVPLSWLRDYVDFDWTPEELASRLTALGMEVQSIDRIGEDWTNIVVGELLDVQKHPNSDRLSLTSVRVSEDARSDPAGLGRSRLPRSAGPTLGGRRRGRLAT